MGGSVFGLGAPTGSFGSLQNPWSVSPFGSQLYGQQPLQQIVQVLQVIPQQLQQLQQLQYLQSHQLQQLQQLIQIIPQQIQQLQQPFSQVPSLSPQAFGAQPVHVM
jgi:hypothetical protein